VTTIDQRSWLILILTERGAAAPVDAVKHEIRTRLRDASIEVTIPSNIGYAFVLYEHSLADVERALSRTAYIAEPLRFAGQAEFATSTTAELDMLREPSPEPVDDIERGQAVSIIGGTWRGMCGVAKRVEQSAVTVGVQLRTMTKNLKLPRGWVKRGEPQ